MALDKDWKNYDPVTLIGDPSTPLTAAAMEDLEARAQAVIDALAVRVAVVEAAVNVIPPSNPGPGGTSGPSIATLVDDFTVGGASGFTAEVLADAPTFFVQLSETSGQHADETGTHTSSTVTVAAQGTSDPDSGWAGVGKGDDFNGSSNYVSFADSDDFFPGAQGDYTVMAVVEVDTIDATFRRIIAHQDATDGWNLAIVDGEGFRMERLGAGGDSISPGGTLPTTGQTYMVHAVCDVTASNTATFTMYVDGTQVAQAIGVTIANMANPAQPLVLGRRDYDTSRYLDGRVYAAAFFKSALSGARAAAHYAARNVVTSGSSGGASQWTAYGTAALNASTGELDVTPIIAPGSGYKSAARYSLVGGRFSWKFADKSAGATVEVGGALMKEGDPGDASGTPDSTGLVMFLQPDTPTLVCRVRTAGSDNQTTLAWNSTTMLYGALVESGGNILFQTGPTGDGPWTTRRTYTPVGFPVVNLEAHLWASFYGSETARPAASFDNVNTFVDESGGGGGGGTPIGTPTRDYRADLGSPGLWAGEQEIGSGSAVDIVASPVLAGHDAWRFRVNAGERAELIDDNAARRFNEGDEWWVGDVLYIPSQSFVTDTNHTLMQFKNAGTGSPPLNMDVRPWLSGLAMQAEEPGGVQYPVFMPHAQLYGRAIPIEIHVKFSSNPGVGFYEVWADGVQKIAPRFMATLLSGLYSYFKQGQYGPNTASVDVYWHGALLGPTRASVLR